MKAPNYRFETADGRRIYSTGRTTTLDATKARRNAGCHGNEAQIERGKFLCSAQLKRSGEYDGEIVAIRDGEAEFINGPI